MEGERAGGQAGRHTRQFPSPRAEARARRSSEGRRRAHRPVFVDDTGRRHRLARFTGLVAGTVATVYLGVVALTFAGVPGLGPLRPPGLGQLTNPAGVGTDVGPNAAEQVVPPAVAEPVSEENPARGDSPGEAGTDPSGATTTAADSTSTSASTTTTKPRGNGSTSTVPGPNSTVPDQPHGPPSSRPERP